MRRDYSRHELIRRIHLYFPDLECLEELLTLFEREGFLDEQRFACGRARHRASLGYGPDRLRRELSMHHIVPAVIEEAVASVDWAQAWAKRVRKNKGMHPASLARYAGFPRYFIDSKENL